jgi:agmatine deiminase
MTVKEGNRPVFLDFGFNGWGLKFPSNFDNQFTKAIKAKSFAEYDYKPADMILEGGSIEYDDHGTLMTTSECLLSPNRNPHLSKEAIEEKLKNWFGIEQVLWLDHGYLAGDDTDSHIDTLARFCTKDTIAYVQCEDHKDEHYEALQAMEAQLRTFRDKDGNPYRLVPLPMTDPIFDAEDGHRLPATYANFLIMNGVVIMPTYHDANDALAIERLQSCFADKKVVTIDCSVLIRQHGSLHCSTMQIPA